MAHLRAEVGHAASVSKEPGAAYSSAPMSPIQDVLIIGAGPAGLAMGACLRERNVPFRIFEQEAEVGPAWRRHYDRLHLHTTRDQSHLPGLPFAAELPQYVPRSDVVAYLDRYAEHFRYTDGPIRRLAFDLGRA